MHKATEEHFSLCLMVSCTITSLLSTYLSGMSKYHQTFDKTCYVISKSVGT